MGEFQFLTINDVAKQLNCCRSTISVLLNSGEIKAYKGKRKWLILQEAVTEYLEQHSNSKKETTNES